MFPYHRQNNNITVTLNTITNEVIKNESKMLLNDIQSFRPHAQKNMWDRFWSIGKKGVGANLKISSDPFFTALLTMNSFG
jgi:hypothetical protein